MRKRFFHRNPLWWVGLCGLATFVLLCEGGLAAGPALAARPALPVRPTLTPVVTPAGSSAQSDVSQGGYIELQAGPATNGLAAVVQWQDALGAWHDVEGWRAQLNAGLQRWWVAPKDFATGPFRWVVYKEGTATLLGISAPFYLPKTPYELVVVPLDLARD